jgi:hypothetical protein
LTFKKPKKTWLNKHVRNKEERGREKGREVERERKRVGDGRELL